VRPGPEVLASFGASADPVSLPGGEDQPAGDQLDPVPPSLMAGLAGRQTHAADRGGCASAVRISAHECRFDPRGCLHWVLTIPSRRRMLPRSATLRNTEEEIMRISFVAKDPDSVPDQSPTLYKTDRNSWLVQGWVVSDSSALAEMSIPRGRNGRGDPRPARSVLPGELAGHAIRGVHRPLPAGRT
jgi:hypothetical protein